MSDKDASGVPIVDFNALAQTNPEVVGWIYAPGTNINYPVVQTNNNSKYLNTLRPMPREPSSWIATTPRRAWWISRPRFTVII